MKSLNIAYNPRIDQLRWLAATIVFLFHFNIEYRALGGNGIASKALGVLSEGHTGVGLFFTLSGFLFMQIAMHQETIVYRDFLRNRLLRIAPLFMTVFMVAISIGRDKFQPQDILYVLTSNLGLAPTSLTVITGAARCISLEFSFYLVFPFLARFAMERGPRYLLQLLGLMLFFKVASYSVNDKSTLMYFSTFVGRFDQFLIGMLAAMLYRRHSVSLHRHAALLLPLAGVLVLANSAWQATVAPFDLTLPKSQFWVIWSILESTAWAGFIIAWVSFDKGLPAWLERALCQGGKVSFSFYLLHMAMLHVLSQSVGMLQIPGLGVGNAVLMLIGSYGATWALATLSYSCIEEPFLRMRRSYGAQKPAPLASAA